MPGGLKVGGKSAYRLVMKVLIGIDGSKEATTALQTASRLLNPVDRHMDLLCVAPQFSRRSQNTGRNRVASV